MLTIVPVNEVLQALLRELRRDQLLYHEYSFLSTGQLIEGFLKKTSSVTDTAGGRSLAALSGDTLRGIVNYSRDNFDSEAFGFSCFRITDLLVFPSDRNTVNETVTGLLSALEEELRAVDKTVHLAISLNNNTANSVQILNSLTASGFYYISTLITFSSVKKRFEAPGFYPADGLTIRTAVKSDADAVATLAKNSFRYSRFHLDPFLDDRKADELLHKSAKNSILEGYADIMFVAEINSRVVGYYSGRKNSGNLTGVTVGEAIISAVDPDFRAKGIFSKLDSHLLNWFADNTDFAEMGTYLANYPVHKTWINKDLGLVRAAHQLSKISS